MAGQPTLAEVMRQAIDARLLDVHTALPGRVKSYDRSKQTAEITPSIRGAIQNRDGSVELEDLPVLPNVPVAWPRGGGYYVHFPLAVGDHVLLIFSEAAIAQWRVSGEASAPGDLTRHDLSYCFAIPCVAPDAQAFTDAPESEALIAIGSGGVLRVSEAGQSAQFVALANLVDARISAMQAVIDAHVHSGVTTGAGVSGPLATPLGPQDSVACTSLKAQG